MMQHLCCFWNSNEIKRLAFSHWSVSYVLYIHAVQTGNVTHSTIYANKGKTKLVTAVFNLRRILICHGQIRNQIDRKIRSRNENIPNKSLPSPSSENKRKLVIQYVKIISLIRIKFIAKLSASTMGGNRTLLKSGHCSYIIIINTFRSE